MFKRAVRKFGQALVSWGSPLDDGRDAARAANPQTSVNGNAPDQRDHGETVGSVEFLGIGGLKAELGSAWPEVQARARPVMREVLNAHLHPEDQSQQRDDETIMIRFARSDTTAARARIHAMADDIAGRLLREVPETEPLSIRSRAAAAPAESDGGDIFGTAAAALDAVQAETEAITRRARRYLLNASGVIYRPIWNSHQNHIMMFRANLDDLSSQTALQTIQILSSEHEVLDTLSDIDIVLLRKSIEHLHSLLAGRSKVFFLVPVNFQTLYVKRTRDTYLDLCRRIPESHQPYIFFEIYGVPAGTRGERLAELAAKMAPFSKGIFVHGPDNVDRLSALANSAITGISITINQSTVEKQSDLAAYVHAASRLRLRVLGQDVDTRGTAWKAHQLGVVLLGGEAIAAKMETPTPPYRWRLHLDDDKEREKTPYRL